MKRQAGTRLSLALYDLIIFLSVHVFLMGRYLGNVGLTWMGALTQAAVGVVAIFGARFVGNIYRQVWRYGGIQSYIKLLMCDAAGFALYYILQLVLPMEKVAFVRLLAFGCMNTLCALTIRMIYRYAYKCGGRNDRTGRILRHILMVFSGGRVHTEADPDEQRIKVAIIGAGTVGVSLAEDLISNKKSPYIPRCFVDNDPQKTERTIHGLGVMTENEATLDALRKYQIQEVIFAVPNMEMSRKIELYDYYKRAGFKIKVFDYPAMDVPGKKRQLREFDISDLLMRGEKDIINDSTRDYYKGKTILITGGGGSIGSEICRQLAKMEPKLLVILDIYENCAYDLQQSLRYTYKDQFGVAVEIASITDKKALARVFREHKPDICINAAAHKHVPLMEKNCVEAVLNNVFGCMNVIECCEEFGCERFMMVSTDKAVNPTNVMGATKRVCEMIMQAYSTRGVVKCSATRFGNVLGSAGSVIPLFKRQIAAGGPVTLTDKRIIRYFMTIPEASQLVLTSGAMAKNGDLFVLDMGKPVKIYDLARNMINMSGMSNIEIIETGLRPGEKLYEELLVDKEELEKTENDMIFIEHEEPVTMAMLEDKLNILKSACDADRDNGVRDALKVVVPTFKSPEEVNQAV